jgi:putative FmdB family regulatory protein
VPLYEYECAKCGRQTEKIEKVLGPHLKKCPHCGGKVERLLSKPAIQFKGSGWYVTDYAGKSGKSDSDSALNASSPASEAKEATAKGSNPKDTGAKETKKTEEKKPEKKK